jgi:hypothetical protein
MWSMAGRNVEGLHAIDDLFIKISVNCVLNYVLHYYLCVYFYGFLLCMLHVCFYYYSI